MKQQLEILAMINEGTLSNTLFLHDSIVFNIEAYLNQIGQTVKLVFNSQTMQYYARGGSFPLFPDLWKAYSLSMSYLLASLMISLLIGIVLTIMTMVFPKRIRGYAKGFFFIIE